MERGAVVVVFMFGSRKRSDSGGGRSSSIKRSFACRVFILVRVVVE